MNRRAACCSATPFLVKPAEAFGIELRMSDGSSLLVLPTVQEGRRTRRREPARVGRLGATHRRMDFSGPDQAWTGRLNLRGMFRPVRSGNLRRDICAGSTEQWHSREASSAELTVAFAKLMKARQYARMLEARRRRKRECESSGSGASTTKPSGDGFTRISLSYRRKRRKTIDSAVFPVPQGIRAKFARRWQTTLPARGSFDFYADEHEPPKASTR